jgi:hypothetical protein
MREGVALQQKLEGYRSPGDFCSQDLDYLE